MQRDSRFFVHEFENDRLTVVNHKSVVKTYVVKSSYDESTSIMASTNVRHESNELNAIFDNQAHLKCDIINMYFISVRMCEENGCQVDRLFGFIPMISICEISDIRCHVRKLIFLNVGKFFIFTAQNIVILVLSRVSLSLSCSVA